MNIAILLKNKLKEMDRKDYLFTLILIILIAMIIASLSIQYKSQGIDNNITTNINTDSEAQSKLQAQQEAQKVKDDINAEKQEQYRQCIANSYIANNTPASEAQLKADCEKAVGL